MSPGDSSVPAKRPPTITASAPAAMALAMSPEYRTPPSAIIPGRDLRRTKAAATLPMAVACGTPTPATIRVVQMEPGPISNFNRIGPGVGESDGGFFGGDVSGDDKHLRMLFLNFAHPKNDSARMAVGGVNYNCIRARIN